MLLPVIRFSLTSVLLLTFTATAGAKEYFVRIEKVSGNRMLVVNDTSGGPGNAGGSGDTSGRGRGMRGGGRSGGGGMSNRSGRGRRRGTESAPGNATTITIAPSIKITAAMRERRTFEFRVLAELPGGLRHAVFQNMTQPLQARIVTNNNAITEVNVITGDTDINQSGSTANGEAVIAIRPKRPPRKQTP
ncbi:MAG: hypothetical protein ACF8CQ_09270 [Rhodopirellula sp. JB044]|uniref:hypothetical protein n=1 Tax=Rhodopirellula sp. JB044 TaxID=3342844 RepID=UPI00370C52C7